MEEILKMKTTVTTLQNMKAENKKIAMLTCYDYQSAKLMDRGRNVIQF